MEENQYINKNRPVYISFVAEDKEKVEALYNNLTAKHIKVEWMYHNLPGNEIVDFERKIGFGEFVILVFGKNYFESWDCMYEFTLVSKYSKLNSKKKIFCVRFDEHDDFKNGNYLDSITKFWQDRKTEGTMFHDRRDLAKYYDYYLNSIPLLRHKYNDFVYLKDNYDSVVKAVQDFFAQNPTPITNSSEIFYKFDKDMWKNFVFNIEVAEKEIYMIPYIKDGLKDEDQVLFQAMIDDLIKDNIIQKNKAKKRLDVGGKVFLSYWNKKGLQLELNPNCSFDLEYYELSSEAVRIYNEKDTTVLKDCRGDFAGVFDNIFRLEDNNKGNTSLIS